MEVVGTAPAIDYRRARRRVRRHRTLGFVWRGFTYDANGNLDQVTDALSRVTDQNVDPLNRLSRTLQDTAGLAAQTQVAYDALDNPTQVTDPKGLSTTYAYTGFSELKTLTSPDTGTTTTTYDAAGNRASQVDARSKTTNYGYDALNRPTTVTYPTASTLDTTYLYDTAQADCQTGETFTIGRLAKMTDGSGSTVYCYDRFGALVRKVQTTNGQSFTLRYAYAANGQLQKTIYPDNAEASYLYDAQGRTQEINVKTATGTTIQLLRSASYHPFGPVQQWTYGNGRVMTRTLNLNGEPGIVQVNATDGLSLGYEFDEVGNLKTLRNGNQTDPPLRVFGYDALSRLTETKDGGTNAVLQSYAYDATGNRTSATVSGVTTTNTYDAASHRLTQVGANARTYDTAGNTTQIAGATAKNFVYGDHNRMTQALNGATVAMNYVYNGMGERVRKYLNTANTYTLYDEAGRWIGDYGNAGAPNQQVIWFDDLPVGVLDGTGASQKLHYIEPDALGTPRVVIDRTRGAQGVAIWRWDLTGEAFGATAPNQDPDGDATAFVFDMRFPGQRYDAASGLNYNYFRDYDASTGRYSQSDPIGLSGGISTFGYVSGNSLNSIDFLGLQQGPIPPGIYTYPSPPQYSRVLTDCEKEILGPYFPNRDLSKIVLIKDASVVPPGYGAMTISNVVYLNPSQDVRESVRTVVLIGHEAEHVFQYEDFGFGMFFSIYGGNYLINRVRGMNHDDAYRNIFQEVAAYWRDNMIANDLKKKFPNGHCTCK